MGNECAVVFAFLCVCPQGELLVAMVMDKDNTAFIFVCCSFFCSVLVWTNQQVVYSYLKSVEKWSIKHHQTSEEERPKKTHDWRRTKIVTKRRNGNAFTIALNTNTSKPIGCGWQSVKTTGINESTFRLWNKWIIGHGQTKKNVVCLEMMLVALLLCFPVVILFFFFVIARFDYV